MMGQRQKLHDFSEDLQRELIDSFRIDDPGYTKGLAVNYPVEKGMVRGIFAPFRINDELEKFLVSSFELSGEKVFESAVFLHYLAVFSPNLAINFLNELIRPKKKLFIGSVPKMQIETLIGKVDYYIYTPPQNSYYSIDVWWPSVLACIDHVEMVIPATGMATRVINKRLWNLNINVQSFDIGSLVDTVALLPTRKWIRLAGHRAKKVLLNQPENTSAQALHYLLREIKLRCYSAIKSI